MLYWHDRQKKDLAKVYHALDQVVKKLTLVDKNVENLMEYDDNLEIHRMTIRIKEIMKKYEK